MSADLLLTFYGDDFTGSTDALEQLVSGGVPTVLFLATPSAARVARFPGVKAVGVAGVSRSLAPEQMDGELPGVFKALRAFRAPFFHYKVCSTFDSSPVVGSIGHAAEIGWPLFETPFIPVVATAPFLGRYVVFGNLFARDGDTVHRLDRHPTMSRHPVTPMREADLRHHLGEQTDRQIGLIDVRHLASGSDDELDAYLQSRIDAGDELIVFDALNEDHLLRIGGLLWRRGDGPVFIVGSSGVETALTTYLHAHGEIEPPPPLPPPGASHPTLVMSGSASPGTAAQIRWALDNGFEGVRLDGPTLISEDSASKASDNAVAKARRILAGGNSAVLYLALGPDDPAIGATRDRAERLGIRRHDLARRLGERQGRILRTILEDSDVQRVCVAGGDTSGHALSQLGIFALEMIQPLDPGAPLCRASSDEARFDGLQIALKGGQTGITDYFGSVRNGSKTQVRS